MKQNIRNYVAAYVKRKNEVLGLSDFSLCSYVKKRKEPMLTKL